MRKRYFDLQLFTDGGDGRSGTGGTGACSAGNGNGSQANAGGAYIKERRTYGKKHKYYCRPVMVRRLSRSTISALRAKSGKTGKR